PPTSPSPALFPYTTLFRSPSYPAQAFRARRAGGQRHNGPPCRHTSSRPLRGTPRPCRFPPARRFLPAEYSPVFHGTLVSDLFGRDRKSTRLNSSHGSISYA